MVDMAHTRLTAADFFALPESNLPTELIDGVLIMSPAPVPEHQRLVFRLAKYIEKLAGSGEVFLAPVDVYLDEANIVQPDVLWIADESQCVEDQQCLRGAPDLIVEVHSPGTVRQDRSAKFDLYEKHGTHEYWMVDPLEQFVEVWQREGERFTRLGVFGPDESFPSALLGGQTIDLTAVFPPVIKA